MTAEILLARLEAVRPTGKGWVAKCPAHEDKRPSLAIAETPEGVVLLRCFAGCQVQDIVAAAGLSMSALFPDTKVTSLEGQRIARQTFKLAGWRAALGVLSRESKIVWIVGCDLNEGKRSSKEDRERLGLAIERIDAAREVLI